MVDLRNCKPGDKLVSKHGLVLEYVRPLPEGDYMDHEVRYPDEAPYKGSKGTRTHEGYVMRRKRLEEDHDIVRIVSSEVMKVETLEEAAEREASLFYEKGSLDWNKYRQVFIEGAKWQMDRSYSEEEVLELLVEMNQWPTTFNGVEEVEEWFKQFKKK